MARTSIEWTAGKDGSEGLSWNAVRGCARVSAGCQNCYAERQAPRFSAPCQPYEGLISVRAKASGLRYTNPKAAGSWWKPRWTGEARFVPKMLEMPLRHRRPANVFVTSMSDLFHRDIKNEQIAAVFGVMAACEQHTFQLLTKRPERMLEWFEWVGKNKAGDDAPRALLHHAVGAVYNDLYSDVDDEEPQTSLDPACEACCDLDVWPLVNLWIGVSVEDQARADERIPLLRQTPAAVRWLSVEPLLERVELDLHGIDWVVVGGESGPGARQCNVDWIRDVVRQCRLAHVPLFVKQLGAAYCDPANAVGGPRTKPRREYGRISKLKDRKGADMLEWPADLRVREFPAPAEARRTSDGCFDAVGRKPACVADDKETDRVPAG